jgi:hypothetical protein
MGDGEWTMWRSEWSAEEDRKMSAVDKEGSGTPSDPPIMVTVRIPLNMVDRVTIAAMSPSTYTCTTNSGKPRGNTELSGMIQERMHNESERGSLGIAAAQSYVGQDTDGTRDVHSQYRQTELTKRSKERLVVDS